MSLEKGNLGNAIRDARIRNNLTQEELAELIDISTIHLKHIEGGHRQPSVEVLFALMNTLHMSIDYLVFQPENEELLLLKQTSNLLKHCNKNELLILTDVIISLMKHRKDN